MRNMNKLNIEIYEKFRVKEPLSLLSSNIGEPCCTIYFNTIIVCDYFEQMRFQNKYICRIEKINLLTLKVYAQNRLYLNAISSKILKQTQGRSQRGAGGGQCPHHESLLPPPPTPIFET